MNPSHYSDVPLPPRLLAVGTGYSGLGQQDVHTCVTSSLMDLMKDAGGGEG